jgi:glycosyltransferase involved in cell wall biosynthesis
MRLLFLAPAPPSDRHGGGALRMLHLVRYLGQRFEVDLVAPALDGRQEAEQLLEKVCAEMEFVPVGESSWLSRLGHLGPYQTDPAVVEAVHRRIETRHYQAIQVEKPAMLPYLPKEHGLPVVLDLWAYGLSGPWRAVKHERGGLVLARNLLRLARFGYFDTFCWPSLFSVLVVSQEDSVRCERARPRQRTEIVPNGVDCSAVTGKSAYEASSPVLLFTGDMSFQPNIDAALFLAQEVFPAIHREHPDAELRFVGRNPGPRIRAMAQRGIVVTGGVSNMVAHLHEATVYVAPHFTGAGTRTKLLEAMAAGLPIVTTTVGIEGISAQPGRGVLIADTATDTINSLLTLLTSVEDRRQLGLAARRIAEARYDWNLCLCPLERLYRDLERSEALAC